MRAAQNISGHHKPFVVSNSCIQERERERREREEREKERERERRQKAEEERGKAEGGRPGQREETETRTACKMLLRRAPRRGGGGEGEGGGGRETKTEETQEPENGEKNSLFPVQKPTQNAHAELYKNICTTRARVPKPSGKRTVTKIELRKTRLRQGELFFATFGDPKQWLFREEKTPPPPWPPNDCPKLIPENPPKKGFKHQPRKKRIFAKHSREQKTNKYGKTYAKPHQKH